MCNCIPITGPAEILVETSEACQFSAGGAYEAETAPLAGGVALMCCVTEGIPTPDVTWSRIIVDSTGIAREVPVDETDADITIE